MMFPLRSEHQLTAPPVKLVRALKTFMRVSGREYHRANSMIIQPAIRTSTLYLRNHPKGNIIETLDDDVLFRSGSPTQYRSSRKADLTSRFFYVWILVYSADVRCRKISSGQSHQLSTGAVKKPTSPVGFFTSVLTHMLFLYYAHIRKPLPGSEELLFRAKPEMQVFVRNAAT